MTIDHWLPSAPQTLLLQSIFFDNERADIAWKKYCTEIDMQSIDDASYTLLPLIFYRFQKSNMPELKVCKNVFQHTWYHNNLAIAQVKNILKLLLDAKINVCFLKGIAMISSHYPNVGLRVMGDIDILVSPSQAEIALTILLKQQWQIKNELLRKKSLQAILRQSNAVLLENTYGIALDLHWSISMETLIPGSLRHFTPQIKIVNLPNTDNCITVLSPEDQLLHTIYHAAEYSPQSIIRWIIDSVFILKNTDQFRWEYFFLQARKLKAELMVKQALCYLHQSEFIIIPKNVFSKLYSYQPTYTEKKYLSFIRKKPARFLHAVKVMWYWHIRTAQFDSKNNLLFSFPSFLKRYWRVQHYHQVFFLVIKKTGQLLR